MRHLPEISIKRGCGAAVARRFLSSAWHRRVGEMIRQLDALLR
jgi:hypothetical protein